MAGLQEHQAKKKKKGWGPLPCNIFNLYLMIYRDHFEKMHPRDRFQTVCT